MALTQIKLGGLAAESVDSDAYVDGSIDLAHLSADSVDSTQYVDASIDNAHLADDAADSDEIAAGAIDLAHMSVNSIDSDQYVDGSIDAAHLASGVGVQGWVQIAKTNLSGAATEIDFTSGIDGTYRLYKFVLENIHMGTGSDIRMRFYIDGAWKSSSHYEYKSESSHSGNDSFEGHNAESGDELRMITEQGTGTGCSCNGTVYIPSPSSTDNYKTAWWTFVGVRTNLSVNVGKGAGGFMDSTAALTGVRFKGDGVDIADGTFTLYGLVG